MIDDHNVVIFNHGRSGSIIKKEYENTIALNAFIWLTQSTNATTKILLQALSLIPAHYNNKYMHIYKIGQSTKSFIKQNIIFLTYKLHSKQTINKSVCMKQVPQKHYPSH